MKKYLILLSPLLFFPWKTHALGQLFRDHSGEVLQMSGGNSGSSNACQPSYFQPPFKDLRVSSCFGSPRRNAQGSYPHQGLDVNSISQRAGAGVSAIANGRVRVTASMGGRSGPTIVMDHPNCPKMRGQPIGAQCVSTFRHLSPKYLVQPGECVSAGHILGTVGTPPSNGGVAPHLHLEIITGGNAYNPAAFRDIVPEGIPGGDFCSRQLTAVTGNTPQSLWNGGPQGTPRGGGQ